MAEAFLVDKHIDRGKIKTITRIWLYTRIVIQGTFFSKWDYPHYFLVILSIGFCMGKISKLKSILKRILVWILVKIFDWGCLKSKITDLLEILYNHRLYSVLINKTKDKKNFDITFGYIASFISFPIVLLAFYSFFRNELVLALITVIVLYRLYDLFLTHIGNIIFKQSKGVLSVEHPARFLVYAMFNFGEIVICFSCIKLVLERLNWVKFSSSVSDCILDSIYFTIVTLVTLGYGEIHPENAGGKIFVIIEVSYFIAFLFFVFPIISSAITVQENNKNK